MNVCLRHRSRNPHKVSPVPLSDIPGFSVEFRGRPCGVLESIRGCDQPFDDRGERLLLAGLSLAASKAPTAAPGGAGIVNLTGVAHLSGISGLRRVTGFQGLSISSNDLKQPTLAQVDDAVCEPPLMLSQRPDLILPLIRSSQKPRNGSPVAGLSPSAPIPAPK
jgi:hypothetical protein